MASSKSRTVVLDPTSDLPLLAPASGEETIETNDAICPACGELLAWHEQACLASSAATSVQSATSTASTFEYELGQPVRPAGQPVARRIVWRGQVKERRPDTGWLHRVNVYRLDDGYWDCYHETELQAA
ncbi:hypothetical protein [Hymenobacter pini]|uniref:hypothetical protein n=1 Tax=Hymenobacter pini TaxID=2880879 RepID=UPI001CF574EA|nr:hypothetical protein [Hymenobacter pini]MCA8830324.1 hypothetical protein [Hymenobacter pini]